MMKMAYTSCMDEKAIADAGAQPITQLLEQLITTFSPNTSDWSAQIIFLRQIGITVFASPAVLYAPTTGDPYLNVAADTSSFLERATNYENATLVREYTEVVADLLDKISPRKFNSTLGTAEGVVEFERKLYHIDSTYSSCELSRVGVRTTANAEIQLSILHSASSRTMPQSLTSTRSYAVLRPETGRATPILSRYS